MARTKRNAHSRSPSQAIWQAALYTRLSWEDGDKPESDSIANQRALLESFAAQQPDLQVIGQYSDDGYTGTNFQRPDFQRMIADIEAGKINCVIVKDLSRFGRDYINAGQYLERWFPEHGVRFLAVNDHIDSERGPYDMLLPFKNVFNEQYARDISHKVKSAMQSKQRQGQFIGAFSSYGYRKDPQDHNKLLVDPCAAAVVQRIFDLYEQGNGKIRIAKLLNEEGISRQQWERVQALLVKDTRTPAFEQNISPFAGFLRCGDCGRAMSKTNHPGGVYYCCGSYKRYGPSACTRHGISHRELEQIVLDDLNKIIKAAGDLKALAEKAAPKQKRRSLQAERERVQGNLDRVYHLKKSAYEDYRSGLISRENFLRYKEDYTRQEEALSSQLSQLQQEQPEDVFARPWIASLLEHGKLTELDRTTMAETVKEILIFEDGHIKITYLFSDELGILNDPDGSG